MRVVDVTSFFSAKSGGIKRYYREKAQVLPSRGLDCHFVAPGPAHSEAALGGGTLHTIAGPAVPFSPEYHLFRPGGALGRLLRRLQPDVVEVGSHYFLPAMIEHALAPLGPATTPRWWRRARSPPGWSSWASPTFVGLAWVSTWRRSALRWPSRRMRRRW